MPLCPTGYALASFRPRPISDSSLGTECFNYSEKQSGKTTTTKKKGSIFSAICFSINLHLGMRRFVSDQNSPKAINGRKNLTPKPNAEPCVERRTVPADTKRCEWCRSRRCHRSRGRISAGLSDAGLGQNGQKAGGKAPGAKQGRK